MPAPSRSEESPALVELENRASLQVLSRKSSRERPLAEGSQTGYLPRSGFFLVLVLVVFAVVVLVEVIIFVVIVVIDGMLKNVTARHFVTYALGSAGEGAAAATGAAAGFGGGYVVQKWRPQLLHTQNWSGVQGVPSPGSRISMSAPQR
jgi:hypothetical protein